MKTPLLSSGVMTISIFTIAELMALGHNPDKYNTEDDETHRINTSVNPDKAPGQMVYIKRNAVGKVSEIIQIGHKKLELDPGLPSALNYFKKPDSDYRGNSEK